MERHTESSEKKSIPVHSIGGNAQPAETAGWQPKRRGEGVYQLKEGNRLRKKREMKLDFEKGGGMKNKASKVFFFMWVGFFSALVLAPLGYYLIRVKQQAAAPQAATHSSRLMQISQVEVPATASAKDWNGALPLEAAQGFAQAESIQERLKWVRDQSRVEPLLRTFFESGPGASETIVQMIPSGSVQRGNILYERYLVTLGGGGSRLICVVLTGEGAKVDFESYARHGSVSWGDLLSGQIRDADEVRLFVSLGNYYNFEFSDDGQWCSFIGRTPDLGEDLQLYARRGSSTERTLSQLTARGPSPVTLAVRSVGQSHQRRLFEATGVLSPSWVMEPQTTSRD